MLYLPYEIASLEGVMQGLYLLYWVQERHLSPAIVAAVLAAGDLTILLLEVPTGWLADRYGHRYSLMLGSAVQVAGMLLCWLGVGVPGLVAASVLVAVGDCFRSGADQALLYRTCVALGRRDHFRIAQARTEAVRLTALVGLVLAGGAIVTACGFAAGWLAETVLCFAGFVIACAMIEPPAGSSEAEVNESGSAAGASAGAIGSRALLMLIVPAALLGCAASVALFLAQTTGHGEPVGMTLLVGVATLAEAAGAAAAIRMRADSIGLHVTLAVAGVACVALGAAFRPAFIPAVIGLSFLTGLIHPLRATGIQRIVPDSVRARAASLANACEMAIKLIALPVAGVYRVRNSSRR